MRRFHRWLGIVFGLFLLSSAVTGILWAYAPYLYWKPGHMEKKAPLPSPPLTDAVLSIPEAVRRLQEKEEGKIEAQSVLLRKDFGRLLYEIEYKVSGGKHRFVIDAKSGDFLSPLSEELTVEIARQYVAGNPPLESVVLLSNWVHRNKIAGVRAFRVRFQDAGRTEVFLDPETGHIL
ncbi:MAG: PepSY domain-containing protein, partial [bacterium]|nr:PepSY domain-containing protein [bacterium]